MDDPRLTLTNFKILDATKFCAKHLGGIRIKKTTIFSFPDLLTLDVTIKVGKKMSFFKRTTHHNQYRC